MALSAARLSRLDAISSPEAVTLARVKHVCNFVNAEVARLRNHAIGVGVASVIAVLLICLFIGIYDPRVPLVIGVGSFVFFVARAHVQLASGYKHIASKRIVAALGKGLTYKTSSSLTRQQFVAMDLFSGLGNAWTSEDEIGGRASGLRYTVHRVQASGMQRGHPAFSGMIIKIDCTANFPGHTVVVPDGDAMAASNAVAGSRVRRDLVMLKNPVFEQMFSVYSSDYYEARRVLTPKLMQAVMQSASRFGTELRMAFVQKSLFVAVLDDAPPLAAGLFSAPLTPQAAVGKLIQAVTFAEDLAQALTE